MTVHLVCKPGPSGLPVVHLPVKGIAAKVLEAIISFGEGEDSGVSGDIRGFLSEGPFCHRSVLPRGQGSFLHLGKPGGVFDFPVIELEGGLQGGDMDCAFYPSLKTGTELGATMHHVATTA